MFLDNGLYFCAIRKKQVSWILNIPDYCEAGTSRWANQYVGIYS